MMYSGVSRSRVPNGRWASVAAVLAIVASLGMFGVISAPTAQAAGSPNLAVAVTGPVDTLITAPSTPMTFTAKVTNPAPNPNGFNLGYQVSLPPGVTFVSSSAGSPTTTTTQPDGSTVLFFENIADVMTNSTANFSIDVAAPNSSYPVNSSVQVGISAYANTDPRVAPAMTAGTTTVTGSTGSATGSATGTIKALTIAKSEPSPEGELPRGIHNDATVYTLKVSNNGVQPTSAVVVNDYLPAGLEFLGCGAWDNTTNSPTSGTDVEYPGAPRLDVSTTDLPLAGLPVPAGTSTGCLVPDRVETVTLDPDGAGPAPTGIYTHLVWTIGTMPVNSVLNLRYAAGIPMRANTLTWSGATPATACAAGACPQAANLDNNSGPETTDELPLTNYSTAGGTYAGSVKPGTSHAVTDDGVKSVTAENLAMQKSVSPTFISRGGLSTWTLSFQTGEYRSVGDDLVIADTLPNGLCPLGTTNFEPAPALSECDPVAGQLPTMSVNGAAPTTLAYAAPPVEHADGTWTVTFAVPAGMAADSTLVITFPTRARTNYQKNFTDSTPVLADDDWTNTVVAASTATGVISGTNVSGAPAAAPDSSSASQTSSTPDIEKLVAVPTPTGQLTCNASGVTYLAADDVPTAVSYYRPGDRVCYRMRITLNDSSLSPAVGSGLFYSNVDVTDYLPPGFTFERYWGINPATGETASDKVTNVVADPPVTTGGATTLVWHLGSPVGTTPRYVDGSIEKIFEVEFSAIVPATIPGGTSLQTANLGKATTVNTAGAATSLRNKATALVTRPSLSLDKSRTPSAAVVPAGTAITYTVAVKNNAPLPDPDGYGNALAISVRDLLPFEVRCASVTSISTPPGGVVGVCTDPSPDTAGARSRIDWLAPGPLTPQTTQAFTYVLTLPTDLAPTEDLVNDAGVRQYQGPVNTGGTPTTYIPPSNIDPSLTPNIAEPANDKEKVTLAAATVDKVQQSELAESGNSRNTSAAATNDQATIGEYVDYTVRATIPANSTVYAAKVTDTLPAGLSLLTSGPSGVTPTAYLNGSALPSSWTFDATTLTVTLPSPYLVDATADVIEIRLRAVVTDVAANVAGQTRVNTGGLSYQTKAASIGVQPTQVNKPTSPTTLTIVEPKLAMTKDDNDADGLVAAGQEVTYTLKATNTGSTAHDVIMTDCVPEHLTVTTPVAPPSTPTGVVVTTANGVVGCPGTLITWTFPSSFAFSPGSTQTLTYAAKVDAPATAGQTFLNRAATTATSYPGSNPNERTSYLASATDVIRTVAPSLSKDVTPNDATVGSTLTYTVALSLPGGLAVPDATVLDALPPGLDFEALTGITCTDAPAAYVCPAPAAVPVLPSGGPDPTSGGALGFFLDDLPAAPVNQPWTITLTYRSTVVDLAGLTPGARLTNSADLRWNATSRYDSTTRPDVANISAFEQHTVADLAQVTVHEPTIITDKDVTYSAPTNAPCDQNHAATTGATDADTCQIAPNADPTTMTYHVTIANTGDWPAYDVTIADSADLPAPSQIAALTITNAGGATVTDGSIADGNGLSFLYPGPLAPGASVNIVYTVELTASASNHEGDQVVNTVTVPSLYGVSAADRAAYPDRTYRVYAGGSDTDTVTLRYPEPALAKSAVSDATDARIGQPFTWSLTASNSSDLAPLVGADLTDILPAGWSYVPGSTTVAAATGVDPTLTALADPVVTAASGTDGPTLTWSNVGTLGPLGTFTIHFQATPTSALATVATTGSFAHVNHATLTGEDATGASGNADGPYAASATAQAYIRRADLELTKAIVTPGPYYYGQVVQYSVTVANVGPDTATGVSVLEKLPAALIFTSVISASQGSYDASAGVWTVGTLPVNAPARLVLSVQVDGTGAITNDAQVKTSDQWDPDSIPGNQDGAPDEDDEARATIDFAPTQLGDRVWLDVDNDGLQDPGEPGLSGVSITLADPGPDNLLGTADDGPTVTTTTDAQGTYLFTGLANDRPHVITVDATTLPGGLTQTYELNPADGPNRSVVTVPGSAGTAGRLDVDFGYVGKGAIGDLVWFDSNGSGTVTQDAGEPGLPNIPVTVTWAGPDGTFGTADDLTFPTTTNASGLYGVSGLPYGNYAVKVDSSTAAFPAGLVETYDADGVGSLGTSSVTLSAAAPTALDQDFSYVGTGSIGDRIWLDQNGDGVQDTSEPGIPGVTVVLTYLGADGIPGGGDDIVFTTSTGPDGIYQVSQLPAGTFTVAVDPATLPSGLAATFDVDGIASANTASVSLTAGQVRRDVDFGYQGPGALGDQVWLDTLANGDGAFNAGADVPMAGTALTVTYLGLDGAVGGGDDLVFSAVTDATGHFGVTGLPLGSYTVAAVPLVPLVETYDADGLATANVYAVTLTAATPVRLDQDFSFTGTGEIGDRIWFDRDGSGSATQDAGEPGLPLIPVTVTWAGPDGVFGNADDVSYATTTDANGAYQVDHLPFGSYQVTVDTSSSAFPAGVVPTYDADGIATVHTSSLTLTEASPKNLDQDFSYTGTASLGDRVWLDQNGDGVQDPDEHGIPGIGVVVTFLGADGVPGGGDDIVFTTTTGPDGIYQVDRLPAGSYTVAVDPATLPAGLLETFDVDGADATNMAALTLGVGASPRDVDFGFRGPGELGDLVWLDTLANGDGVFSAGPDAPLAGTAITVTYLGLDGEAGGGDDIVFTTITDATGHYSVANLPLGAYTVAATSPVPLVETFDADGVASANVSAVSLTVDAPVNLDQDFSYTGTGSIGHLVWDDENADGVIDASEAGIPGVTLTVTWAGPDGVFGTPDDLVLPSVTTGPDGSYLVPNLPAGLFQVELDPATLPVGMQPTYDVDAGTLRSATVSLEQGQNRTDVNFGEREVADLMVVKTHPAGALDPGGSVTFRLTVTNLGPSPSRSVHLVDVLPVGVTFTSVSGDGWTCSALAQTVTCDFDSALPADASVFVDLVTVVELAAAPGVTNTATVTSATHDPNPDNNTSSDPVVVQAADLAIVKTLEGELVPDGPALYILTVTNHGPSVVPVGKVVVTDTLPADLVPLSATSDTYTCQVTGQHVVCTNATDVPVAGVARIVLTVRVIAAAATTEVTNAASVTGGFVDPDPTNNTSSVTAPLYRLPNTGSESGRQVGLGLSAILAGLLLVAIGRRRRSTRG